MVSVLGASDFRNCENKLATANPFRYKTAQLMGGLESFLKIEDCRLIKPTSATAGEEGQ